MLLVNFGPLDLILFKQKRSNTPVLNYYYDTLVPRKQS